MSIDSTVKGASANSYVSVADADTYFNLSIFKSLWTQLSTDEKEQFLVFSTSRLDTELFSGSKTNVDQALQMPRKGIIDRTQVWWVDEESIPYEFTKAVLELVTEYIKEYKDESPTFSKSDMERMSDVTIGPLKGTLRKVSEYSLPDIVKRHLRSVGHNFWIGNTPFKTVIRT